MNLSLLALMRVAWHATAALMAEAALAFLAYSTVFGYDGAPTIALYMTAAWSFLLNVYLAIALLLHNNRDGVKVQHPKQTILVGLHAFTATAIFANIIVRALFEVEAALADDMRRWPLFAAIYLEATIGVFHLILALCACVGYGHAPRDRAMLSRECERPDSLYIHGRYSYTR